ncbi:MAG: cytochrome P450, partial [Rhodococcus sp. (in: high G+C Gram-positive bacteria)]|uniref:cytochrome P450 n=1 Tax=Rhodococcus sp. TaxID=1831 RepID=UPI003BB0200B
MGSLVKQQEDCRMASKTIPHPPRRVPILGDVFGIDPETPNQTTLIRFDELGPIYRRSILGTDLTFVGSPDLAAQVYDEEKWEKFVGRPLEQLRPLVGDGLFTAYNWESNWSKAHEVLMPAFTKESMVSYHDTMVQVTEELCAALKQTADPVPVVDVMGGLTLEVIGRCGFGYSFDSFSGAEEHPFVGALTRSLTYAQKSGIPLPFIGKLLRRKAEKQNRADRELLVSTVDEVIAERQRTGERRKDLLDRMLHPEGGTTLDSENIRNQVLTFLTAGHETSVNTLSFALHFLAQNPEIAGRVRAEALEVFGTSAPRYEDIARLRYTRQVISETLRLWPTAPGFFRAAKED